MAKLAASEAATAISHQVSVSSTGRGAWATSPLPLVPQCGRSRP